MKKLPLLMTASVDTRGMSQARFSPEQREEMYIQTLRFYGKELLDKGDYTLVFTDNSGWDLNRIKAALPERQLKKTEFLSLDPAGFDVSRGKGYNEVLLIRAAIEQSAYIRESRAFFKATGRYPVYNIRYFLDYGSREILEKQKDLYIDIKDHSLYRKLGLSWCSRFADVRLFGVQNTFFLDSVFTENNQLNDQEGRLFEGLMYNLIKPRMDNRQLVYRFNREPRFGGLEGSLIPAFSFAEDHNSLKSRIKRLTGNVLRTLAPDFLF
ncbi:MAG: hypothetical protein LRY55_04735 [Leadbetterella sp.]|nr:hypothetical protein [Leadbetterella sp.]